MKNIMAMSATRTYDIVKRYAIHAFPNTSNYPKDILPFFIPVGPKYIMENVYYVDRIVTADPRNIQSLKKELPSDYYKDLVAYDRERRASGFGYSDAEFVFCFLQLEGAIRQPFKMQIRNSKALSFDEVPVVGMGKKNMTPLSSENAWIFSFDSNRYDLHGAMRGLPAIEWDVNHTVTRGKVKKGDIVYLYEGRKEQNIMYRCKVIAGEHESTTIDESPYGGTSIGTDCLVVTIELERRFHYPGMKYKDLLKHGLKGGSLTKRRVAEKKLIEYIREFESDKKNILNFRDIEPAKEEAAIYPSKKMTISETEEGTTQLKSGEEKEAVVKIRLHQSDFRNGLLEIYGKCCVCGISNERVLIASHIKPWSQCKSGKEKTDPDNGLLLCPNHDKLFDSGLISFSKTGKIMVSSNISKQDEKKLALKRDTQIKLSIGNKKYMEYHRENIYVK